MISWLVSLIIAAMLWQHWSIRRRTETGTSWEALLEFYRWTMRAAVFIPVLFIFGCTIVLTADLAFASGKHIITAVRDFLAREGPISVLFIAFFAGVLRLFAERAIGGEEGILGSLRELYQSFFDTSKLSQESTIGNISSVVLGNQRDAWFGWLCVSLFVTLVHTAWQMVSPEASASPPGSQEMHTQDTGNQETGGGGAEGSSGEVLPPPDRFLWYVLGLIAVSYIALGYILWIYMVLFSKLTQAHHLSSRAARLFLGGVFRDQFPRQVVLVGPSNVGKTRFCTQRGDEVGNADGMRSDENDSRGSEDTLRDISPTGAGTIDIRVNPVMRDSYTTIQITSLDSAGENMGDHILLASILRSDVLVFVLDLGMIDVDKFDNRDFTPDRWHNIIKDSDEGAVREARNYLRGFGLATKRADNGTLVSSSELFKVRSFMLYLNDKPLESSEAQVAHPLEEVKQAMDANMAQWQRLARLIGERFGVAESNCCCVAGDASRASEGFNLLASSTEQRLQMSIWPRKGA